MLRLAAMLSTQAVRHAAKPTASRAGNRRLASHSSGWQGRKVAVPLSQFGPGTLYRVLRVLHKRDVSKYCSAEQGAGVQMPYHVTKSAQ